MILWMWSDASDQSDLSDESYFNISAIESQT